MLESPEHACHCLPSDVIQSSFFQRISVKKKVFPKKLIIQLRKDIGLLSYHSYGTTVVALGVSLNAILPNSTTIKVIINKIIVSCNLSCCSFSERLFSLVITYTTAVIIDDTNKLNPKAVSNI